MGERTPPVPKAQSEWASLQRGASPFAELHPLHPDAHMGQMTTQSSEVTARPLAPGLRGSSSPSCVCRLLVLFLNRHPRLWDPVSMWADVAIFVFVFLW